MGGEGAGGAHNRITWQICDIYFGISASRATVSSNMQMRCVGDPKVKEPLWELQVETHINLF